MTTTILRAGLLGLALALFVLPAAASPANDETSTADEASAGGTAASEAAASETAGPQTPGADAAGAPATGRIIFFRPKKMLGAALVFKVREGEQVIGMLKSGTYFVADVTPGAHTYAMRSETKDELTVEVEAGGTHYVMASVQMGALAGRPNLSLSDQAAFDEANKKKLKDMTGQKGKSR
ncbi:DUF2846 domain-containing protein [Arenimonas fontis]|uniref:DUF2846 domain-containing protein n=1 Tax=Arenimonas fontis TaxID=2608255 RepID=A0A5B2Z8Y5_9GAMM|nr:DUF2846 domain-containing protein [Arenimonas fontis]KAA2284377.1 hypothetical protein F0415_09950 [Arenimonas fontis]